MFSGLTYICICWLMVNDSVSRIRNINIRCMDSVYEFLCSRHTNTHIHNHHSATHSIEADHATNRGLFTLYKYTHLPIESDYALQLFLTIILWFVDLSSVCNSLPWACFFNFGIHLFFNCLHKIEGKMYILAFDLTCCIFLAYFQLAETLK